MYCWRQKLIEQIPFQLNSFIFVYDSSDFLSDEELLLQLKQNEVKIFTFIDRADLRLHYEEQLLNLNQKWLFKYLGEGEFTFPFDMLQTHKEIKLSIHQVFPNLSLPILQALKADVLDVLYKLYSHLHSHLNNFETCDFLLKRVYKLHYDTIETTEEWITFLIQMHNQSLSIPEVIVDFIIDQMRIKSVDFTEMFKLAYSKKEFFNFLQKEWNLYVQNNIIQDTPVKEKELYRVANNLFLSSETIRRMAQHFFIEGQLKPIAVEQNRYIPEWAHFGVRKNTYQPIDDIQYLTNKIETIIQDEKVLHKSWIKVINLYSQMKNIQYQYEVSDHGIFEINDRINTYFKVWMIKHYQSLSSFSPFVRPAMVHHILPYMQYREEQKQALVVLDGMSFVQWKQIKQTLDVSFNIEESGVFAWVPTITEISRRAIFHAEIPRNHSSISEENAWKQFWKRESVADMHITFENHLAQGGLDKIMIAALQKRNTKKAAIIIRNIDALTHGAIQGLEGMYAEIDVWLKTNYLQDLISELIDVGYSIYITSDHGNTEGVGIGRPQQGALVETKGERVRIYTDQLFRDETANVYSSIKWPNGTLSDERHYLLAECKEAFVTKNNHIVSHGGITLEEVVVPFVKIDKRK